LVENGLGYNAALSLIFKGKSYQKLKEIIAAQGGNWEQNKLGGKGS